MVAPPSWRAHTRQATLSYEIRRTWSAVGGGRLGGHERRRSGGALRAEPVTSRHATQCGHEAAHMVTSIAPIAQQHRSRTALGMARLACHMCRVAHSATRRHHRHRLLLAPELHVQELADNAIHRHGMPPPPPAEHPPAEPPAGGLQACRAQPQPPPPPPPPPALPTSRRAQ
jgi:hypothetical protein